MAKRALPPDFFSGPAAHPTRNKLGKPSCPTMATLTTVPHTEVPGRKNNQPLFERLRARESLSGPDQPQNCQRNHKRRNLVLTPTAGSTQVVNSPKDIQSSGEEEDSLLGFSQFLPVPELAHLRNNTNLAAAAKRKKSFKSMSVVNQNMGLSQNPQQAATSRRHDVVSPKSIGLGTHEAERRLKATILLKMVPSKSRPAPPTLPSVFCTRNARTQRLKRTPTTLVLSSPRSRAGPGAFPDCVSPPGQTEDARDCEGESSASTSGSFQQLIVLAKGKEKGRRKLAMIKQASEPVAKCVRINI